jgi:outer membrane protein TolC
VQQHGAALQQAWLSSLAEEGGIQAAQGAFDPVLFGDVTLSYSESPAGGFFSAFGTTKTRGVSATQGLRQALTTGGSLSLSVSESYNDYSFLPDPQSNVALNAEWNQPLLRGAWRLTATQELAQARFASDRAQASLRQADTDVVQAAVDGYWNLAFAQADVVVKERSLELARALKEMTEAKFRVGAVAEIEVVQTDADIATRTDALLSARHQSRLVQDELRLLIFGFDAPEDWAFDLQPVSVPPAPAGVTPVWEECFAAARDFRADLRQLRVDADSAQHAWDAAEHDLMPKLDLVATGTLLGQESQIGDAFEFLVDRDFPGLTFGVVFEVPLGNDAQQGAERSARWRTWLALRALRDAENRVANEVREAVRNLGYQSERVAVTRRAREVATRQLEAEQRRLREGASTNFQVLQFQTDLSVAESSEVQALMDHAKALVRLNTVRGLNWDGSRPDLSHLDAYLPDARFSRREPADR